MSETDVVKRELSLTLEQWEKIKNALDFYERAAMEFLPYPEGLKFRDEDWVIYDQMPDEVF